MTSREAFKIGFLKRCAEDGLTLAQTKAAADKAAELLEAYPGKPVKQALLDSAFSVGLPVALGAPLVLGGGLGYALGRMTDIDDKDVEEAKTQELIDEYTRQTSLLGAARNRSSMADRLARLKARRTP